MRADDVKVFVSLEHACGYFPERVARNLVLDPMAEPQSAIYASAMRQGFRRAGSHVYRPYCQGCQACTASRIAVADFCANRSQKRTLARNADLQMTIRQAAFTDEYFALYQRYLRARHRGGGMDQAEPADFENFLFANWSPTQFLEFRLGERLVAVAVIDVAPKALSAVYTFFEPDLSERSFGTFAVLRQIQLAAETKREHVYLGFWIENHPKMDYKRRFSGTEILQAGRWLPINSATQSA